SSRTSTTGKRKEAQSGPETDQRRSKRTKPVITEPSAAQGNKPEKVAVTESNSKSPRAAAKRRPSSSVEETRKRALIYEEQVRRQISQIDQPYELRNGTRPRGGEQSDSDDDSSNSSSSLTSSTEESSTDVEEDDHHRHIPLRRS